MNQELPDVQARLRKGRGTKDQITNIYWIISEKAMATHSSTFAWKIPWMEEPGRLQSMGSQRVGLNDFTFTFFYFIHFKVSIVILFFFMVFLNILDPYEYFRISL